MGFNTWKRTNLGEICKIDVGFPFKSENFKTDALGIRLLRGKNVSKRYIRWGEDTRWIDIDKVNSKMPKLSLNDIVIGMDGSLVGKNYSLIKDTDLPALLVQRVARLRAKHNNSQKYLYYLIANSKFENYIDKIKTGSTIPHISVKQLYEYDVVIPLINEQKAIANILSSLDDKIEINNKINQNLEMLAQTLYKQWFVDFEFPNEDGEPYKSSGGEMVDSELGLIPKGWEITKIGDVCETVLGGTPSRKVSEYWNGDINWINSSKVNEFRIIHPSENITNKGLEKSSTKLLPKKTTVIAITGATLGAVSLLEIDSCANQSVIGFLENSNIKYTFLYQIIKNQINGLIGRQTGGAQQHINKNDVNQYKIILPNKNILDSYHKITHPIHNQIANNLFQNQKLAQIRDTLLPNLMNGEIEVPV